MSGIVQPGLPPGALIASDALRAALIRIASGATLDEAEAEAAFDVVMSGRASAVQIAALLTGLRVRGETVSELTGAARAMRAHMLPVPGVADAIDVCGTGGDGHATLNVSTAVAFILAALGVPVAKHGNRALTSRAGATDTLQALGLGLEPEPRVLEASLQTHGLAFMAAPLHHPAMRHAAPVRAELGYRTLFNLLGPLCNPAGVRRQMIGVFDPAWQEPVARTLRLLGSDCVWVVHGEDEAGGGGGLDELGLAGPNRIVALEDGRIVRFSLLAEQLGLPRQPIAAIAGGEPGQNAKALERLLDGEPGAYRDTVLLNAACALQVSARGNISGTTGGDVPQPDQDTMIEIDPPLPRLREGLAHAARAIDSGLAARVLSAMRREAAARMCA